MAPGEGGGVERGGKPRDGQWWCGHEFLVCSWYETFVVMVELKLLEFSEFKGCQRSVHLAGYGQQVACQVAVELNRALLVRRDDRSEEIKFRKDTYLTTVDIEGRGAP